MVSAELLFQTFCILSILNSLAIGLVLVVACVLLYTVGVHCSEDLICQF